MITEVQNQNQFPTLLKLLLVAEVRYQKWNLVGFKSMKV